MGAQGGREEAFRLSSSKKNIFFYISIEYKNSPHETDRPAMFGSDICCSRCLDCASSAVDSFDADSSHDLGETILVEPPQQ